MTSTFTKLSDYKHNSFPFQQVEIAPNPSSGSGQNREKYISLKLLKENQ